MTEGNNEAPRATVELTEAQVAYFSGLVNNQLSGGQNSEDQAAMLKDARRRLVAASDELDA